MKGGDTHWLDTEAIDAASDVDHADGAEDAHSPAAVMPTESA